MPDNKIHRALLSLLRSGLWGENENIISFPLSGEQWVQLYNFARQHTIEGIVFDGVQRLPFDMLPPRELMLKWAVKIDQIERRNMQMNVCIEEELNFFNGQGLYPVLLKGQGVAACYAVPEHRVCGDIDWYFEQKNQYQKANRILKQRGIKSSGTAGFSTEYVWRGILTEHHTRMFDIHNPFCFTYLDRLQKQFYNERLKSEFQGHTLLLPAPILMVLQVNVHILKHLLSFGVGLRQLCDSARVYHTYQMKLDGQELKQIYQTLGILKWIHLLHTVLVKFMGLPSASLPFELPDASDADWMMDEILMSGNFGFFHPRFEGQTENAGLVRSHVTRRLWSNMRRYFKFAPMEAVSFPLVQFYSKLAVK
ncbi:hypothetical protein N180_00660 [Pedobacter antarcticus 4BY]|uniref:Nucleotidyltransferase family protein n=2 Tax=Pedobacter antarcticus TaxID=34086 RepID=A0A081PBV9_9SPHI|nr:nucleotidyltransferase family protein [Pedobacter antarcticus]KEQ28182.1 hypothetical protein N180_00660 [Pedobacter antarcticus 4BY]SFE44568.1 Uncharacterised nucleotidyltransferase [Pedobacter antarcticus]